MTREVKIIANILKVNDSLADENRHTLRSRGIYGINVMASPGAGKTSVILQAIAKLSDLTPVMVIEGDIASSIDADMIAATGTAVIQINTGGGCHLDANMIRQALDAMELYSGGLLFIENVGNLICLANWDLGEELRLAIASVPEGHDKPFKYPGMFAHADLVVLNKMDLAPYFEFDLAQFTEGIRAVNPDVPIFPISCRTGEGVEAWLKWLQNRPPMRHYETPDHHPRSGPRGRIPSVYLPVGTSSRCERLGCQYLGWGDHRSRGEPSSDRCLCSGDPNQSTTIGAYRSPKRGAC